MTTFCLTGRLCFPNFHRLDEGLVSPDKGFSTMKDCINKYHEGNISREHQENRPAVCLQFHKFSIFASNDIQKYYPKKKPTVRKREQMKVDNNHNYIYCHRFQVSTSVNFIVVSNILL